MSEMDIKEYMKNTINGVYINNLFHRIYKMIHSSTINQKYDVYKELEEL